MAVLIVLFVPIVGWLIGPIVGALALRESTRRGLGGRGLAWSTIITGCALIAIFYGPVLVSWAS